MKQRANILATAAFVIGVVGFQMYARKLHAEVGGGKPESVLLVTQDLAAGATLSEANLTATEVPSDYLDARRVRASDKGHLLGVQVSQPLKAGEGLLWSDITDGAAHKHLAALVTPGRRAYTIEEDANPLGRLLRVADHVDVLLESGGKTSTLLEHVLVLAVGGQIQRDDALLGDAVVQDGGVTLSVTSEQAAELLAAEAGGSLRLVLRNPEDQSTEGDPSKSSEQKVTRPVGAAPGPLVIEHVR